MNTKTSASVFLLWIVSLTHPAVADWPQYRGSSSSGMDEKHVLPTSWNVESGENIRWYTPIPGLAHSSPIAAGDRVHVGTTVSPKEAELKVGLYGDIASANDRETQEWRLLELDKTSGKIIWNTLAASACKSACPRRCTNSPE